MKKEITHGLYALLVIMVSLLSVAGISSAADTWDKTFAKSDQVIHEKVFYPNRYGITVAADMYMPKDMDHSKKYAAILVGTPYGGVKEQGAGIYAQTMAERGFVAMAFDESYNGESSGEPRHLSSPDIFVEDFSAGVDFLGTRPFVDREKIGVIGICGSGGFALTDRVRGSPLAPVCPQNRAYGSVHGSSCNFYPLIKTEPMFHPVVRSYFLSQPVDEPANRICFG